MESGYNQENCVICQLSCTDNDSVTVTNRGLVTLMQFSRLRRDSTLERHLSSEPSVIKVHLTCRKAYTDKRKSKSFQQLAGINGSERLYNQSSECSCDAFQWTEDCLVSNHKLKELVVMVINSISNSNYWILMFLGVTCVLVSSFAD